MTLPWRSASSWISTWRAASAPVPDTPGRRRSPLRPHAGPPPAPPRGRRQVGDPARMPRPPPPPAALTSSGNPTARPRRSGSRRSGRCRHSRARPARPLPRPAVARRACRPARASPPAAARSTSVRLRRPARRSPRSRPDSRSPGGRASAASASAAAHDRVRVEERRNLRAASANCDVQGAAVRRAGERRPPRSPARGRPGSRARRSRRGWRSGLGRSRLPIPVVSSRGTPPAPPGPRCRPRTAASRTGRSGSASWAVASRTSRLDSAIATGLQASNSSAVSVTAASRSAAATTRWTSPIRAASSAANRRPDTNRARACPGPIFAQHVGRDRGRDQAQPGLGEAEVPRCPRRSRRRRRPPGPSRRPRPRR